MKEWHYVDAGGLRLGPVGGARLRALNDSGEINALTLVWREGLDGWRPFMSVAPEVFPPEEEGELPPPLGACAYSGRVAPLSEMLPYGEALVCAEHKDAFVRKLMESGKTDLADLGQSPFVYVGFWMRVLGAFIDYFVKLPASWVFMIPYYLVTIFGPRWFTGEGEGLLFVVFSAAAYGLGLLGMLATSVFYETWMVGKFQGTLGKMAIGAKIVKPDGSRLNYRQAFYRWFANHVVSYAIISIPPVVLAVLIIAGSAYAFGQDNPGLFFGGLIFSGIAFVVFTFICCGVYWMAAFDSEKRALHDRIAATRVVKK